VSKAGHDEEAAHDVEAARQQALVQALFSPIQNAIDNVALKTIDTLSTHQITDGLNIYRNNGLVLAAQTLQGVFSSVHALLGEADFAALAKNFWRAAPPGRGDLGEYGAGLAAFIDNTPAFDDMSYLADCAKLDWACHQAERAVDAASCDFGSLELLQTTDERSIRVELSAGVLLVRSAFPIVTLRLGAQSGNFSEATLALSRKLGENALVFRDGFRVRVRAVDDACALWIASCLQGESVGTALDAATEVFDFSAWLETALADNHIAKVAKVAKVANQDQTRGQEN
jgi:hypothetical protein